MVVAGHIGHDGALIGLDGGVDVCRDGDACAGNTDSDAEGELGSLKSY